jgi:putative nucleotidyltransferase with HDIG domain
MALTADVNSPLEELEAAVKHDQSCVARLLQLTNSAFHGSNTTVTSVRRAILMFGFNAVQDIAQSLTVFDSFHTHNTAEIEMINSIRLHSLAVATLARHIADVSPRQVDAETAYCAGLLHDLGRLVLLDLFSEEYYEILTELEDDPDVELTKVELDTFEVTHTIVGQWLAEQWRFPAPVLQVIAAHHYSHIPNPLLATVMVADLLVKMQPIGLAVGHIRTANLEPALRALGLTPRHIPQFAAYLEEQAERLSHLVTTGVAAE